MNIVVLDGFVANSGDLSWEPVSSQGNFTLYPRTAPDETYDRSKNAEIIFTNKVVLDAEMLRRLPKLRFVGVLATGYNNVDVKAAAELGITVCNVPAYSTDSVAQTAFALLLSVTNRVADYFKGVAEGDWGRCIDFSYRLAPISELAGKTMGIYGFGNIGRKVADIAHAFGMRVISSTSKPADVLPGYLEKVSFDDMLAQSDVLSLHAPLTDSNRRIINADTLAKMKPGAILINTARGGLIDERALADALSAGNLGAAAVDVLEQEPPRDGSPLLSAPRCYITPHIAWESTEARERLIKISGDNLRAFLAGNPVNKVN